MIALAVVILVDPQGRLLLQERDEVHRFEGRQIVFVAPDDVPALDLAWSSRHFLPQLLVSDAYGALLASHAR